MIQPESVKTDDFEIQMKQSGADVFVVIAFGHILSEKLLSIPGYGAINVHGCAAQVLGVLRPFSGQLSTAKQKPA